MGGTRFFESLVDSGARRGGTRRRATSVLRTKMAVSGILPGKATVRGPRLGVSLWIYTWPANEGNLRDVTKGALLGPVQREACIALVTIGFQVSGKALRLHRHAAWKQTLRAREISAFGVGVRNIRRHLRFRRRYRLCPSCASSRSGRMPAERVDVSAAPPP